MARFAHAFRLAVFMGVVLGAVSAAHAQYPVMVFGKGFAAECYEAVKGKQLNTTTLKVCDRAIKDEPMSAINKAATYNNRGVVYMRMKDRDAALRDYESALRISPNIPETQINLGAMFYTNGMYTEAITVLNEGVKAEDQNVRAAAHYNRGLSLEKLGELEEAYADFRRAVQLRPGFESAEKQLSRYSLAPRAS